MNRTYWTYFPPALLAAHNDDDDENAPIATTGVGLASLLPFPLFSLFLPRRRRFSTITPSPYLFTTLTR